MSQLKLIILCAHPMDCAAMVNFLEAEPNADIVLIRSVMDEMRDPMLLSLIEARRCRVQVVATSVCASARRGRGRCDLAVADFLLNVMDDLVGDSPARLIVAGEAGQGSLHESRHSLQLPHNVQLMMF